jgi:hypothetical protein
MCDFGVIISCCAEDVHLARGCCASVRHFLTRTPICLIVDGDIDVGDFVQAFGVMVMRRSDFADPDLRRSCFGWGRTKMASHWEAPWPTFLLVDADTILWGDVRCHARFDRFDMISDRHVADVFAGTLNSILLATLLGDAEVAKTERKYAHVKRWYFDVPELAKRVPGVDWTTATDRLFCPGALFARRGILSRERLLAFIAMGHAEPGLFSPGEMGVLNATVLESDIRLDQRSDLHQLVYMSSGTDLARRFPVGPDGPVVGDEAVVIHWAGGQKPTIDGRLAYSDPMTFFRRRFLRACGCHDRRIIDDVLAREDEIYAHLVPRQDPAAGPVDAPATAM